MTDSKLPPFDADVLDILAAGKPLDNVNPDAKNATWMRVERSVDAAAIATAAHATSTLALSKLALGALVAGSLITGGALTATWYATRPSPRVAPVQVEKIVYRDRIVEVPVEREVIVQVPVAQTAPSARAQVAASAPSTTSATPVQASASGGDATHTVERALVARAQNALARGRFADALAATEEHRAQFPRGWLEEEREAIAIQAMVGVGRTTEARDRAAQFITTYPRSLLRAVVEHAADQVVQPITE